MMKKLWLTLGLAFIGATCLAAGVACDKGNDEPTTYIVTFVQEGEAPISKPVQEGGSLADANIPVPQDKTGYTVTWDIDEGELTNIQSNITINAVFTANKYTVTFDLQEGETLKDNEQNDITSMQVTYDAPYSLPEPTKDGFVFQYWMNGTQKIVAEGTKWTIAENVTVTAKWEEALPEFYYITFVYGDDQADVVIPVQPGEDLAVADIPELPTIKGHTVSWSVKNFDNVSDNMTVHLNKVANKYKIYLNATSAGKLPEGQLAEVEVTYGEEVPTILNAVHKDKENYAFSGWYDANGKRVSLENLVYEIEGDLTLEARYFYVWIGPY